MCIREHFGDTDVSFFLIWDEQCGPEKRYSDYQVKDYCVST